MDPTSTQAPDPTSKQPPTRLELVFVFAAIALGIGLRFYTRSALWLDEALSVNIAALPVGDIPAALRQDGHPPLYYFLLHYWMEIVGSSDGAVRALSGLFSLATLPVLYMIGLRKSRAVALFAVAFLAVLPYMARYSTETRMYSLVILLAAAGWLFLVRLHRPSPRVIDAAGLAVTAALLLYTHYWTMWLLAVVATVLLWNAWRSPESTNRLAGRYGAVSFVAAGISFLPWVPSLLDQLAHTGTPWGTRQRPTASLAITLIDLAGGNLVKEGIFASLIIVLLVLAGLTARPSSASAITVNLRTIAGIRLEFVIAASAFALGLAITFATGGAFASRYAAFIIPVLAIVSAYGVTAFPIGPPRTLALLLTVIVLGAASVIGVADQRSQSRQAATVVNETAAEGDIVLVCPDQLGPAFSRYTSNGSSIVTYPSLTAPDLVDWRDYADRNAAADPISITAELRERAKGHDIWIVWMGGYASLEHHCEAVRASLMETHDLESLLAPDSEEFFEPMAVDRFIAR